MFLVRHQTNEARKYPEGFFLDFICTPTSKTHMINARVGGTTCHGFSVQ